MFDFYHLHQIFYKGPWGSRGGVGCTNLIISFWQIFSPFEAIWNILSFMNCPNFFWGPFFLARGGGGGCTNFKISFWQIFSPFQDILYFFDFYDLTQIFYFCWGGGKNSKFPIDKFSYHFRQLLSFFIYKFNNLILTNFLSIWGNLEHFEYY